MKNINLIECIGKNIKYLDGDGALFGEIQLPSNLKLENEKEGIAVSLLISNSNKAELLVKYITVYNKYSNFEKYQRSLPEDLDFSSSPESAEQLFLSRGFISKSNHIEYDINYLGSRIYTKNEDSVVRVTFQLSDDKSSSVIVGITLGRFEDLDIFLAP